MIGRCDFTECVYCQGVIGEPPVWYGGYAYHKNCLEAKREFDTAIPKNQERMEEKSSL